MCHKLGASPPLGPSGRFLLTQDTKWQFLSPDLLRQHHLGRAKLGFAVGPHRNPGEKLTKDMYLTKNIAGWWYTYPSEKYESQLG
jgi:hypothetical protein